MSDLLPAGPLLSAFLVASFVLAVTPGPGVFYVVTRSVLQGRRFGLASVAGVALGNLGNAVGTSIGLAALFVGMAAVTDTAYAFAAGAVAPALSRARGRAAGRYLTGGAFIGLGVFTALAGGRSAK